MSLKTLSKEELINRIDVIEEVACKLLQCRDPKKILPLIVDKVMEIMSTDGCSLYLLTDDKKHLSFEVLLSRTFETSDFVSFNIPLEENSLATFCFNSKESLNLSDVYLLDPSFEFKFNDSFDKYNSYRTKSMLVVPLIDSNKETIGVIQLINRKNYIKEKWTTDESQISLMPNFSSTDMSLVKRFARLAAMALERADISASATQNKSGKEMFLI